MSKTIYILSTALFTLLITACSSKEEPLTQEQVNNSIKQEIRLVQEAFDRGATTEAIRKLEELQDQYPENVEVLESIAFAYSDMGDHSLAAFYFEHIARLDEEMQEALIFAAQAYEAQEAWSEACRNYELYLKHFPGDGAAWKALSDAYTKNNQAEKAEDAFEHYIKYSENHLSSEALLTLASKSEQAGNIEEAKKRYSEVLANDSEQVDARLSLLQYAVHDEKWDEAEAHLRKLESMGPEAVEPALYATAKTKITQQVELKKKAELIRQTELAKKAQEAAEAEKAALNKVAAANDNLNDDGDLFSEQEESSIIFEKSAPRKLTQEPKKITLKPKSSQEHIELARSSKESGNLDRSVNEYWKALTINPNPAHYWQELSDAYYKQNDFNNAEIAALEATRREPNTPSYTLNYLRVVQANRSGEQIMTELQNAKNRFPNNADITLVLARGYERVEGNHRNAMHLYKEFLKLSGGKHPHHAEVQQIVASSN